MTDDTASRPADLPAAFEPVLPGEVGAALSAEGEVAPGPRALTGSTKISSTPHCRPNSINARMASASSAIPGSKGQNMP